MDEGSPLWIFEKWPIDVLRRAIARLLEMRKVSIADMLLPLLLRRLEYRLHSGLLD